MASTWTLAEPMDPLRPSLGGSALTLNWGYLEAIARGQSAIDLRGMALRHREDAERFAREYGFDLTQAAHRRWIRRVHREAVAFIRQTFLSVDEGGLIPAEVTEPEDEVDLLVYASRYSHSRSTRRLWSCAVLKVMHALFYIDNNPMLRHFDSIRAQIFAGLDSVIRQQGDADEPTQYVLTDGELVLPLLACERKSHKDRSSILLKLLQKSAYVAEHIYDHLGVRLTFETRSECLLALRVLQRSQLLSAINVESHRTRNNLLDLPTAREVFNRHRAALVDSVDYPLELLRQMDAEMTALAEPAARADNPHSAASFRSIQITVRKMIHLPLGGLETGAVELPLAGPAQSLREGTSFYFNYEIQLLDRHSRDAARSGPASHSSYKQRQIATARARVLGPELAALLRAAAVVQHTA